MVKKIRVFAASLALTIISYLFLAHTFETPDFYQCVGYDQWDIDEFEHHFIAANFALTGKFPYVGFLANEAAYKLCPDTLIALYPNLLKKYGPVTVLNRPPIHGLLQGTVYRIMGIQPSYARHLNLLLLAFIAGLMPLVGYGRLGLKGFFIGMISAGLAVRFVFLSESFRYFIQHMGPEITAAFMCFIMFLISLNIRSTSAVFSYLVMGASIGLVFLTKGVVVLYPVFFIAGLFIFHRKENFRSLSKKSFSLVAGIVLVVFPWVIYINKQASSSRQERTAWVAKLKQDMHFKMYDSPDELFRGVKVERSHWDTARVFAFVDFVIKDHFSHTIPDQGFIMISNQGKGDDPMGANNEYCIDGDWHPEWKLLNNSYYRLHPSNRPAVFRMLSFYYENPALCWKIMKAKLANASSGSPFLFWMTCGLWALGVWQYRARQYFTSGYYLIATILNITALGWMVYFSFLPKPDSLVFFFIPLLVSGVFLFKESYDYDLPLVIPALFGGLIVALLLAYGDTRFMDILSPVSIFCNVYLLFRLLMGYFGKRQAPESEIQV